MSKRAKRLVNMARNLENQDEKVPELISLQNICHHENLPIVDDINLERKVNTDGDINILEDIDLNKIDDPMYTKNGIHLWLQTLSFTEKKSKIQILENILVSQGPNNITSTTGVIDMTKVNSFVKLQMENNFGIESLDDNKIKVTIEAVPKSSSLVCGKVQRCNNYPEDFDLDKSLCKSYFKEFGKVKRIVFKKNPRAVTVEYTNEDDFLNALNNAGEYNNEVFTVVKDERGPNGKKKVVKTHSVSYIDYAEVNEELAAMVGYSQPSGINVASNKVMSPAKKLPKLNRVWQKGDAVIRTTKQTPPQAIALRKKVSAAAPAIKKKTRKKIKEYSAEQQELIKVLKSQARTVEEKYRVLDARDKLLRLEVKGIALKSGPTEGTCPDMCPEKERLMREVQHQVSIYELDDSDRRVMNPNKAVKQYSRSSADQESPLPHELRSVNVLQMTMNYLMVNIMDVCDGGGEINVGEWFHFLWDRTRGIRKDITQQNLCCQGSVELVEQCARFHIHCSARLMGEDPSVFDQKINTENLTKCLQTLKYMYHDLELKGQRCTHEAEFRAYIILLNLNDGNFMWEVQKLRHEIQKSSEVKFALQIYSAFDARNYVKFFKLVKSTSYLNTCILMRYFMQVRVSAIKTLIRCFTPPKSISFYPIKELTKLLYFDNDDATKDFMQAYGLVVNKDDTQFLIERSSFMLPEFTYVLDRSELVESKRGNAVGKVVCGQEISPEIYMAMSSHEVQNSFDKNGYLIRDELFPKIEKVEESILLDTDSEDEPLDDKPTTVANIFTLKPPTVKPGKVSPMFVVQPKEENLFSQRHKPESLFGSKGHEEKSLPQAKQELTSLFKPKENIFAAASESAVAPKKDMSNIFARKPQESKAMTSRGSSAPVVNIFAKKIASVDQPDATSTVSNIFAKSSQPPVPSIFSTTKQVATNIFALKAGAATHPSKHEEKPGILVDPSKNIFAATHPSKHEEKPGILVDPSKNIFAAAEPQPNIFASSESKKGGFTFNLPQTKANVAGTSSFLTSFKTTPPKKEINEWESRRNAEEIRKLEGERAKIQEELRKEEEREEEESRLEEARRKNEEAAEIRRLEAERQKREEEMRRLREEMEKRKREEKEKLKRDEDARRQKEEKIKQEKQRQEEELKRKLEEEIKRKELEEKQRLKEIEITVDTVVKLMVDKVETQIREAILSRILGNMQRRSLVKIARRWRNTAIKNVKKRKAADCGSVWINPRNIKECADDLHMDSQDVTLRDMKRYKRGRPLDIPLIEEPDFGRINLFQLTYSALRRRLVEIKEKWHQHIYWKVVVSLPDEREMKKGLARLENHLNTYLNWRENDGTTFYIENHKTATFCLEKQQGLKINSYDANGFVFIATSFNSLMQQRVFENLKNFGVFVKLPIAVILEDVTDSEDYLKSLKETGVVTDYLIYSCNLASSVLPSVIDNAFIFLSRLVEKNPPLELDTLGSIVDKCLCSEIWKKASSFAKWNSEYKICMRDPNIVISLYNQGLKLLMDIVSDENCMEYAKFPEVFLDYLPETVPDFLPCNFRYFPHIWTKPSYQNQLRTILQNLTLPKFEEDWPPKDQTDLMLSISKYCSDVFHNPKQAYIAVFTSFKADENFEKISWVDAIEILAKEKLKEQNLELEHPEFRNPVFKTFIAVYHPEKLNDYIVSDWFYRNNPTIEKFKKTIKNVEEEPVSKKRSIDLSLDCDVYDVITKAEKVLRRSAEGVTEKSERHNQMNCLNRSISDLEDSIRIIKKIDQKLLKRFLE